MLPSSAERSRRLRHRVDERSHLGCREDDRQVVPAFERVRPLERTIRAENLIHEGDEVLRRTRPALVHAGDRIDHHDAAIADVQHVRRVVGSSCCVTSASAEPGLVASRIRSTSTRSYQVTKVPTALGHPRSSELDPSTPHRPGRDPTSRSGAPETSPRRRSTRSRHLRVAKRTASQDIQRRSLRELLGVHVVEPVHLLHEVNAVRGLESTQAVLGQRAAHAVERFGATWRRSRGARARGCFARAGFCRVTRRDIASNDFSTVLRARRLRAAAGPAARSTLRVARAGRKRSGMKSCLIVAAVIVAGLVGCGGGEPKRGRDQRQARRRAGAAAARVEAAAAAAERQVRSARASRRRS